MEIPNLKDRPSTWIARSSGIDVTGLIRVVEAFVEEARLC